MRSGFMPRSVGSRLCELTGWGVPDPDGFYDGPMPATKATLQKVLEETGARTLQYIYDFGDDWDHSIRIERSPRPPRA